MNSWSNRLCTRPALVAVLAVSAALWLASPVAAQLTTSSPSFKGITTPAPTNTTLPNAPMTGGQTTPNTTNTTDPLSEFEQTMISGLREMLALRFPGADEEEINFLADLVYGFFMEQLFCNPQLHQGMNNNQ